MTTLSLHPRALRKKTGKALRILLVLAVTLLFVSPLYISLIYSLKASSEMGSGTPLSLPRSLYLQNYRDVIEKNSDFRTGFVNSLITTVSIVLILTLLTPMASYVLARSKSRGYAAVYYLFLMGILIPFQCIMFPTYLNLQAIGLMNTLPGFILVRAGFQVGICILVITDFVKTVPTDLEEAAYIDGATIPQTFFRIIFPLIKPINVTMIVLNTLFAWNDFYVSVTILQSTYNRTLPLAQFVYRSESGVDVNMAFAFFTLSMLPVVIVYLFAQKYIVSGIMSGAVKG